MKESPAPKSTSSSFAADQMDKENAFWKTVLWPDETKTDLFGHTDQKNTVAVVKLSGGSIKL